MGVLEPTQYVSKVSGLQPTLLYGKLNCSVQI